MSYVVKNHRLEGPGVTYAQAKTMNGVITPTLSVVHDTASPLTPLSAARYLQDNSVKTSVHLVVERDGATQQQVPFNRGANHAGTSTYHGRSSCNAFSIGMEIVNPGFMTYAGNNKCLAWWGATFDVEEYGLVQVDTPQHGAGRWWMPYTEEQLAAVRGVQEALFDKYGPTLADLQPHWYISPGRKVDTNPLFPLEALRSLVLGRSDEAEPEPDGVDGGGAFVRVNVPGDTLNVRRWPSFNPNVVAAVPHGTEVPLLKVGTFDGREWSKVLYGGVEGWVVSRYVQEV